MRKRVALSVLIGLSAAVLCWLLQWTCDFDWALTAAHDLLTGHDPYARALSVSTHSVPYPLPAAAFALPFLYAGRRAAGSLFFGASSALLAFGLTREGYDRLLIFLAFPYWAAMLCVQWPPLLMAGALLSSLLPAVLAKPQIGLPILLTHWSRRGVIGCCVLAVASLLVMPSWPMRWLSNVGGFTSFVPLLVLPLGPILLLALWRSEDPDMQFLLLTALTPQHWFYDSFILWLIPKRRREILVTNVLSWCVPALWGSFYLYHSWNEFASLAGTAVVTWLYVPMLALLLLRNASGISRTPEVVQPCPRDSCG
jgi:hypothetical protein